MSHVDDDDDDDACLRSFAHAVQEYLARIPIDSPYRFGRHKVFLAALPVLDTRSGRRLLIEAHRAGYLRLSRADLTPAMDRELVRASEIRGGPGDMAEWHLIEDASSPALRDNSYSPHHLLPPSYDDGRDPASRKRAGRALWIARRHRYNPALGDIVVHRDLGPGLIRLTRGSEAFVVFGQGSRVVDFADLAFLVRPEYRHPLPPSLPRDPLARRREILALRRFLLVGLASSTPATPATPITSVSPPHRIRVAAKKPKVESHRKPTPIKKRSTASIVVTPRPSRPAPNRKESNVPPELRPPSRAELQAMRQRKINLAVAREADLDREEWWTKLPDRTGMNAYTVMVRGGNDPERRKSGIESGDIAPHHTIKKTKPEEWAPRILKLLSDGQPRTLNRIGVELIDKTADITAFTTFGAGLWLLVERGNVEYTPKAPVYFRIRGKQTEPKPYKYRTRKGRR